MNQDDHYQFVAWVMAGGPKPVVRRNPPVGQGIVVSKLPDVGSRVLSGSARIIDTSHTRSPGATSARARLGARARPKLLIDVVHAR